MLCKRSLCRHALSVCPSVTFVDSVETNKHICIFSPLVAKPFYFFHTKRYDNILAGTPTLTGLSNAGGIRKNRDSRRIAGYRSMTGGVRTTTATVHRAVYRTDRHASQPARTTTVKRKEQNRIYLYAAVNLKRE